MKWTDKTDRSGEINETVYTLQATEHISVDMIDAACHVFADRAESPVRIVIEKQREDLAARIALAVMQLLGKRNGPTFFKVEQSESDGLELVSRVQLRAINPDGEAEACVGIVEPRTVNSNVEHLMLMVRHVDFIKSVKRNFRDGRGVISIIDEQSHERIDMLVTRHNSYLYDKLAFDDGSTNP